MDQSKSRAEVADKFGPQDMEGWNANQKVVFLEALHSDKALPKFAIEWLDEAYELAGAANSEVNLRFFELALGAKNSGYEERAAEWVRFFSFLLTQVSTQGRMKYCRAIYKALYKANPELARKTFKEHKSFCMYFY